MVTDKDKAKIADQAKKIKDLEFDNQTLVKDMKAVKEKALAEISGINDELNKANAKLNEDQPDTLYTAKTFNCDTTLGRYVVGLAAQLAGCAETIQRIHLDPSQKADKYALKAAIDSLQETLTHAQKAYK